MLWSVIKDCDDNIFLNNNCKTIVKITERFNVDYEELFLFMQNHGVPFAFTNDLNMIYFTVLKDACGDYLDNQIRLSCGKIGEDGLEHTLIHEIGHHLDEKEGISIRPKIIEEKGRVGHRLCSFWNEQALESPGEYVSIGFEKFYFGGKGTRERLKRENPKLYNVIRYLHRKYNNL